MAKLLVPLLSVISVVIGIVPAYLLYFSQKIEPAALLEKHASLKMLHKFFWNRWYIDNFYQMFFVGGIIATFSRIPKYIENPLDRFCHLKDSLGRVARISILAGIIAIFSRIPKYIENPLDRFCHLKDSLGRVARISIPALPGLIYRGTKHIRIETGALGYNLIYILISYIVLIIFILLIFLGVIK